MALGNSFLRAGRRLDDTGPARAAVAAILLGEDLYRLFLDATAKSKSKKQKSKTPKSPTKKSVDTL